MGNTVGGCRAAERLRVEIAAASGRLASLVCSESSSKGWYFIVSQGNLVCIYPNLLARVGGQGKFHGPESANSASRQS
jgi:hypothetical protein